MIEGLEKQLARVAVVAPTCCYLLLLLLQMNDDHDDDDVVVGGGNHRYVDRLRRELPKVVNDTIDLCNGFHDLLEGRRLAENHGVSFA
jgi:hypothetical protein